MSIYPIHGLPNARSIHVVKCILYSMEVILFILWLGKQQRGNPQQIFWKSVFFEELGLARRLGIVWDRYNPVSIRESTRDKRGHSCRQRVTGSAKVPRDRQTFLKNVDNKNSFLHIYPVCYRQDNCRTKRAVHHRRWLCEACGWRNYNRAMQPWRGRYLHINPSFTCPLNKVNRTYSHWRYWYTSKSLTNHLDKPSSWHLDLLPCRQIQQNNTFEQYCRKSWQRDLQISGTDSCTNGLKQHIYFQI